MVDGPATADNRSGAAAFGSVRQRLILLALAIAIPALLGAGVLIRDAYRFTRAQAERQLLETTRAMSSVVDRQLGQSEALLSALRTSPDLARGDLKAFDDQAHAASDASKSWIVLYDTSGRQLVNTRFAYGTPLPASQPDRMRAAGRDLRAGRTHYCDLTRGPVTGRPVLCVAVPVTQSGVLKYALLNVFEPKALDSLLRQQRLPAAWYGVVVDTQGRLISRTADADKYRGHVASKPFIERLRAAPESVREGRSLEGVAVLSAIAKSPISGWSFAVGMPRAELASAVQRSLALGVIASLLLLALGIVLALLVARSLTRPIERLALDAQRLGFGDPLLPRVTGVVELDAVSRSLAQASSDLSALNLRLSLATQAGRIGVWENGDGAESWWSNSFYDVLRIDPSVAPDNRYIFSLVLPEDRDALVAAILGAEENESFDATFRIHDPDGGIRWLTSRGRCLSVSPRRVVGICFDVTRLQGMSEELEAANATLEARVAERTAERDRTWKLGRDLFVIAGLDTVVLAVNPAWTDLLGWNEAELVGRRLVELIHPEDLDSTKERLEELVSGKVVERHELRLRHRDGRWRCVSWVVVPEDGRLHAVGRDVTDERAAAVELANTQAALHEAQKLETLGQLTGGVAHDFNNLLTPIVGTLDLLRRRFVDDKRAVHLFDTAIASADRARTLVDRLLTFARRQTLKPRAVDVGELIDGMVDLIRRSLGPKIPVVTDVPADLPPARVDPNQLELALLNLAVNARDAMPDGGSLTVAAGLAEAPAGLAPGRYIRVSVRDEGEGMDAETLRRAVEPFFSTKGIGKGTGLGLSMAHGLAAQSGGRLTLESAPGLGTSAMLYLPAATEAVDAKPATPPLPTMPRHSGRILIVDDEPDVRATTAAMLGELGCEVVEASSGAEALAMFRHGIEVDAMITDHLMPGMQGATLVGEARKLRPALPMMIISGYAEPAVEAEGVLRLGKPFLSAELSAQLARLLKTREPA